ncbi:hypothetical protein EDB81DRAFT_368080 [Dactylonectria macrodidyma]|uniref:Uncharacterized protein n=1 Tax=Dactylonectria macrodidyma TaxID=307937 RepID=A0A9P9I8V6_9HYPO|nr:hypothetical protein EDB81DRAFT_368080 [Dactylonectria macrodidyma]
MRVILTAIAVIGAAFPVQGLTVDYYNEPNCRGTKLDSGHEGNTDVIPVVVSAHQLLSYPSVFVSNLPSTKCWGHNGQGCSGSGGQLHFNAGSKAGCFNAANGVGHFTSVCCSIAQGNGHKNHDMYQV